MEKNNEERRDEVVVIVPPHLTEALDRSASRNGMTRKEWVMAILDYAVWKACSDGGRSSFREGDDPFGLGLDSWKE